MMFERSKDLQRKSFGTSMILILLLSIIGYFQFNSIISAQKEITVSQNISRNLTGLLAGVIEIEKSYPLYWASNDSALTDSYRNGRALVEESLNEIGLLSLEIKYGQKDVDSLIILTDQYLSSINSFEFASSLIAKDYLLSFRNIYRLPLILFIADWSQIENQVLQANQLISDNAIKNIVFLLIFLIILLIIISIFFNDAITSDLTFHNNFLRFAETIAGIGSCSFDIHKNKLSFSNNLYKLLGTNPGDFDPTVEKFMEFVHPKDQAYVSKYLTFDQLNFELVPIRFRIITREAKIKHISSTNQYFEKTGLKFLIIVFRDVTEETSANLRLEAQNQELQQKNQELASFNHVASHDLQEPLRKIQTIISRLQDMKELKLSEKGMDYFRRIHRAATHMQSLILDLLTYTSISNSDKKFEITPLRPIIQKAVDELNPKLKEKNAKIILGRMPTALVDPIQIRQLFLNLISNSIKYAKSDLPLILTIKHEEPTPEELKRFPDTNIAKLIKISVEDNGIGFDQVYALKIFILFNRLHGKTKYPGTGIGLAICQKIVENHKGFIYGLGDFGKGAKFTIIIPDQGFYD